MLTEGEKKVQDTMLQARVIGEHTGAELIGLIVNTSKNLYEMRIAALESEVAKLKESN